MTFNKALLIHHNHAGKASRVDAVGTAAGVLAPAVRELVIVRTDESGEGEALCRERGEQFDVVFILGGDGTVHECVNGLADLQNPPLIGVLPGGTCNDFARSLGLSPDVETAARQMLEGHAVSIDIGRANDRVFTNFFGIGLISDTSQNINSNLKGTLGKLSYFISTLQTINNTKPFHYEMEADGKTMEGEAVMIYAANGRFLGTNSLPFAPDALQDGELDVLVIHETGIPLLREILSHKPEGDWQPQNESISYLKASTLKLRTDAPMSADTDGELYMKTPAELSVLAGHLTFLTGDGY
ncbi:diacylglycerol/lipid kinase family protein [Paenibacillus xylanilyticus]|uniref:Diacylglycerol kinase family lipid kinase n=1 Tax=Paenibacillus xylanilyticus TaxID=248903 RepID=A0A7Y6C035_9BACL|nr:diacylglycerol kinase family protein [Paenibacillus xylanilyticus]NUU77134.1 diacylglycerol kinase family lipid kinase [Paenibacillus xylanilyticus]